MGWTNETQLYNLFLSCGFGFCLGVYYDVFRVIRLVMRPGKRSIFFQDLLFFSTTAVFTFIFALIVTGGAPALVYLCRRTDRFFCLLFYDRPGGCCLCRTGVCFDSSAVARPVVGDFLAIPDDWSPSAASGSVFGGEIPKNGRKRHTFFQKGLETRWLRIV